ncbi:PREDICTED: zinc metalloproteinase nas-4-like [Wasmannia auropunctata]|uniref:zinc metalloproteinase nas-4-like n=1 Tax=Wasmannia auropunctata TaxID=64793 RepID=UPI0005EF9465|nr:PREDICTED: zinc metalloproteinase nas-4-like [Wasmannia auropunctata]
MFCRLLATFSSTVLVLTIIESVRAGPYSRDVEGYKTEPDHETGAKVARWIKEMNINPEEMGNYYEGDIMISNSTTRNGDRRAQRWINGVIPYKMTGSFTQDQINNIYRAMNDFHSKAGIRFVQRTNQYDHIDIRNDNSGCWSYVGRQGGRQQVNLQTPGCTYYVGVPVHELNHAVGFWHEQSRDDRDWYVDIVWNNIPKDKQHNFNKYTSDQINSFNVVYDYASVMHYSANAFAINPNQKTIITKVSNQYFYKCSINVTS